MTTLREAAQMALEALGCIESPMYVREINEVGKAMGALRAALQVDDINVVDIGPVAWHYTNNAGASVMHWEPSASLDADLAAAQQYPHAHKVTPLYAVPPIEQAAIDKWRRMANIMGEYHKPLSEEEILKISDKIERSDFFEIVIPFARAIEAAHGIVKEET